MNQVVILSGLRTPMAGFKGKFAELSAPELGAAAISAVINHCKLENHAVGEVYFGNVVSAGVGQAPARQASLQAGLPEAVPCTTVSKVCGSGMKAIMLAADSLVSGHIDTAVAGGMESMSNAPYLLSKARAGFRLGHQPLTDSLFCDGLEDADSGRLMGVFGQETADRFGLTRKQMDDFAIESLKRARVATEQGFFKDEIAPVKVSSRKGTEVVDQDEQIATAKPEKIPTLKPAFKSDGTVTAANSSSISDGAAALVLMNADVADQKGLSPMAIIRGYVSHAQAPAEFTLAPSGAIGKLLEKVAWSVEDVDLFEINEAFALVTMLAMQELGIDHAKVNVNGGACALGHPLGASGARIVVTLVHALKRLGKKRGVASLCIGGGEATAIAIEMLE